MINKLVDKKLIPLSEEELIEYNQRLDKMAELQAEYDAEEWKRNRQAEYPTHEECIHALLDGGDTLTELQAKRTATKLNIRNQEHRPCSD